MSVSSDSKAGSSVAVPEGAQEFSISRELAAPRELVFKAWTERDRMAEWFGPKGVTMVTSSLDLRPGGIYHYCMRTPDGSEMWGKWVFREIVPPERLVFVSSFSDPEENVTRHPMAPDWPLEMITNVTFTENAGRTTVTVRWAPIKASQIEIDTFNAAHASMNGGWTGTFQQLEAYLAREQG